MSQTLTITRHDPRTDPHWDQDARQFSHASFFHSAGWARALLDCYGYEPHFLRARANGRVVGLLPLLEARSPLTGRRGISLPFTDDCETLAVGPEVEAALWREASVLAEARHWDYLETRGLLPPEPEGTSEPATPSVVYLNHRLALTAHADEVFGRLHASTRRAIRKAEKNGLVAEACRDEAAVDDYYALHCQTRKFHGLPPQSRAFFQKIHQHGIAGGEGVIILVRHQGRPVGGGVFFRFGQIATYKFGASDREHLHLRPNNLMMWAAIRYFCGTGATVFDFGRTSVWNAGLRQFKLHWGTTERKIGYHRFIPSTREFVRKGDPASGWHVRLFQRLPIWASRLAGELLYRHVA